VFRHAEALVKLDADGHFGALLDAGAGDSGLAAWLPLSGGHLAVVEAARAGAKAAEGELDAWRRSVVRCRKAAPSLNFFTTKTLRRLASDLVGEKSLVATASHLLNCIQPGLGFALSSSTELAAALQSEWGKLEAAGGVGSGGVAEKEDGEEDLHAPSVAEGLLRRLAAAVEAALAPVLVVALAPRQLEGAWGALSADSIATGEPNFTHKSRESSPVHETRNHFFFLTLSLLMLAA